jgi:hypothetical protein
MTPITALAEEAIRARNVELLRRLFAFLSRAHQDGNRAVANAIAVSVLEHLEFRGEEGAAAYALLGVHLQAEWHAVHAYMHHLVGGSIPVVGALRSSHSSRTKRPKRRDFARGVDQVRG